MTGYEEYLSEIGKKIHALRAESGMSLRSFSLMSGVHYNQILRIEKGEINPSIKTLYLISKGLDVDLKDLLPD